MGMEGEGEVGEKDVEKEESRRSDRGKDALGLRTAKNRNDATTSAATTDGTPLIFTEPDGDRHVWCQLQNSREDQPNLDMVRASQGGAQCKRTTGIGSTVNSSRFLGPCAAWP